MRINSRLYRQFLKNKYSNSSVIEESTTKVLALPEYTNTTLKQKIFELSEQIHYVARYIAKEACERDFISNRYKSYINDFILKYPDSTAQEQALTDLRKKLDSLYPEIN